MEGYKVMRWKTFLLGQGFDPKGVDDAGQGKGAVPTGAAVSY